MYLFQWMVVFFCLLITACAPTQQNWQGASTKKVFKQLGYPNRVVRLRKGRYLLIYLRKDSPCKTIFKINKESKVISTRFHGGKKCKALTL